MKLLVDMNLSPRWIAFLRDAGNEAVHWSEIGAPSASDLEVMAWARTNRHLLLTNDLDFGTILAVSGEEGPSVIQLRSDGLDPQEIGAPVLEALRQFAEQLDSGALLSLDPVRARVRLLPLKAAQAATVLELNYRRFEMLIPA